MSDTPVTDASRVVFVPSYVSEELERELAVARRERDAILKESVSCRSNAERWQYFKEEMDLCDVLRMIASGTNNYDSAIDAARRKK